MEIINIVIRNPHSSAYCSRLLVPLSALQFMNNINSKPKCTLVPFAHADNLQLPAPSLKLLYALLAPAPNTDL